jgi:hypothetical protein
LPLPVALPESSPEPLKKSFTESTVSLKNPI